MPLVAFCQAACRSCRREFPYPSLGDHSYGEFILHRDDGRAFRYMTAFNNDVWNFIATRLKPRKNESERLRGDILREVVARLADYSEGRSFTIDMVCPHCNSRMFRDWGGKPLATEEIHDATFYSFTALDDLKKMHRFGEVERVVRQPLSESR